MIFFIFFSPNLFLSKPCVGQDTFYRMVSKKDSRKYTFGFENKKTPTKVHNTSYRCVAFTALKRNSAIDSPVIYGVRAETSNPYHLECIER